MKPFGTIVVDPAWKFDDKLTMSDVPRGADANYHTMTLQQIVDLPIEKVSAKDAVLVLWVPAAILDWGFIVMKAWGFNYKQLWVWVKTKKKVKKKVEQLEHDDLVTNLGRLARSSKEVCLVGIRGDVYPHLAVKNIRDVFPHRNLKHSTKPDTIQDALDKMFPTFTKLELFGRRARKNWTVIGDEAPGYEDEDINDVLNVFITSMEEK